MNTMLKTLNIAVVALVTSLLLQGTGYCDSNPADSLPELSIGGGAGSEYPSDVQKYIDLSDTCNGWANQNADAGSEAVEAVNQHANFTSTRCYTLQVKYNNLMEKYEGQGNIEAAIEAHHLNY